MGSSADNSSIRFSSLDGKWAGGSGRLERIGRGSGRGSERLLFTFGIGTSLLSSTCRNVLITRTSPKVTLGVDILGWSLGSVLDRLGHRILTDLPRFEVRNGISTGWLDAKRNIFPWDSFGGLTTCLNLTICEYLQSRKPTDLWTGAAHETP